MRGTVNYERKHPLKTTFRQAITTKPKTAQNAELDVSQGSAQPSAKPSVGASHQKAEKLDLEHAG